MVDHRLRLAPTWTMAEGVQLKAQVDGLAWTRFGAQADTFADPVSGSATSLAFTDGAATTGELALTRAWAEVQTGAGKLSFGRMPMQWGAGILWNPGNDPLSEYGDSVDRLSYSTRVGPVFLLGTADVVHEGYVNEPDDMVGYTGAVGYRSETSGVGLLNHVRSQSTNDWLSYTGDFWAFANLGPAQVQLEAVGTYGGGNLEGGINDVSVLAFGALLDAQWRGEHLGLGVQGGYASGDSDPTDTDLRSFSFDRDHNVALMMFEEPLPTLRAPVPSEENDGRTTEAALLGEGVSNALYVRPRVSYKLGPVEADLVWITARMASGPTSTEGRRSYGNEFDLGATWTPRPKAELRATAALYLPGSYLSTYTDGTLGGGFDQPAFGGRLLGTVSF
jgi:hypothetical protein